MDILDILDREPIRLMDGRYSTGFVDLDRLRKVIESGYAEVYTENGVRFVRKLKTERGTQ